MPKVSVYVPKGLHERLKEAGITPGPICVAALEQALDDEHLLISDLLRQQATRLEVIAAALERRFAEMWDRVASLGADAAELFEGTRYASDYAKLAARSVHSLVPSGDESSP